MIGIIAVVPGCVRWPDGSEGEPEETDYQLRITIEVDGEINSDNEGFYYIVMDADGNSATGPEYDISFWDDEYYYIKCDDGFFDFAQVKDDSESTFYGGSISGNEIQVIVALTDLEDPNSIDINVVTTDTDNNPYDHLDSYFNIISNFLGVTVTRDDSADDSGDGGTDFDIVKVTAVITTLY